MSLKDGRPGNSGDGGGEEAWEEYRYEECDICHGQARGDNAMYDMVCDILEVSCDTTRVVPREAAQRRLPEAYAAGGLLGLTASM